jgi:type I restriction enzyme S subunit
MKETKEHIATKKLSPQLRFKEFDGSWESKPCIVLFKNIRTKGHKGLPIYSVTLDRGMIPRNTLDRKTENAANPNDNILVAKNNISYNMMRMWQGAFGKAPEDCMVSPAYVVLEPKKDVLTDFFIEYFYKKRSVYLFTAYSYGLTSDRLRLYFKDLARIKFNVPLLPEQQKIASFLSAVDDKIQQLTKKKKLLEHYKKGVMQQLFSGQLRFKDENGKDYSDWEETKLVECVLSNEKSKIQVNEISANVKNKENKFPFFTSGEKVFYSKKYLIENENIFMSTGGKATVQFYNGRCSYSTDTFSFSSNIDYSAGFIFYFLQNIILKIENQYFYGSGLKHLDKKGIMKYKLLAPSQAEQQKIATYLSRIDSKIRAVNTQITQTQTFKNGLLQQLFV